MTRRRSLLVAGGVLLAGSMARRVHSAQAVGRIGFVSPVARGGRDEALLQGLRDLGWVEGSNLHTDMRFANGQPERLRGLVDELIRHRIEVLVVGATIGARAAKSATTTLPIVFAGSSDPLAGGIVTNLARPVATSPEHRSRSEMASPANG